ncbi:MAG TPA: Isoquinoline 1-oxidoreductase subunit [Kofleriaceae bacterium]|nr:Isoquinoline 1-oxidoreductase subunit [Kofleriaceae bacterium]
MSRRGAAGAAVLAGLGLLAALAACPRPASSPAGRDPARAAALAAFVRVAAVLRHPRCINCHTTTEFPRQGDQGQPHVLGVRRGPDDRGEVGMRCSACHQAANQLNGVPGAPSWALAPLSMGWEGLDDHALAEALKDRARNGGRSLGELVRHMSEDPLVDWGWRPGGERAPVPVDKATFLADLRAWIAAGAPSSDLGSSRTGSRP